MKKLTLFNNRKTHLKNKEIEKTNTKIKKFKQVNKKTIATTILKNKKINYF